MFCSNGTGKHLYFMDDKLDFFTFEVDMTQDKRRDELIRQLGCEHGELGKYLNTMVNDIIPPTTRHGQYLRDLFGKYDGYVASFILAREKKMLEEIEKPLNMFYKIWWGQSDCIRHWGNGDCSGAWQSIIDALATINKYKG